MGDVHTVERATDSGVGGWPPEASRDCCMRLLTKSRAYMLFADNVAEAERWADALTQACALMHNNPAPSKGRRATRRKKKNNEK